MIIMFEKFLTFYLDIWIFSIPITIFILYISITEFLDLIFNTKRINKMNKYFEDINPEKLQYQYEKQKNQQSNLDKSLLADMIRQIDFEILFVKKGNQYNPEKKSITRAKEMSDIFKLK